MPQCCCWVTSGGMLLVCHDTASLQPSVPTTSLFHDAFLSYFLLSNLFLAVRLWIWWMPAQSNRSGCVIKGQNTIPATVELSLLRSKTFWLRDMSSVAGTLIFCLCSLSITGKVSFQNFPFRIEAHHWATYAHGNEFWNIDAMTMISVIAAPHFFQYWR